MSRNDAAVSWLLRFLASQPDRRALREVVKSTAAKDGFLWPEVGRASNVAGVRKTHSDDPSVIFWCHPSPEPASVPPTPKMRMRFSRKKGASDRWGEPESA